MTAIHPDDVRCRVSGGTTGSGSSGALFGSDTATSGTHRLRFASICVCIAALVAFARWPAADAAQPDYRVPWLRGIRAITVSDNVVVDGSGMPSSSPCHLDRIGLEHHSAEILHKGGLDAIGAVDRMAKLGALQSEVGKAVHDFANAPPDGKPHWDYEQAERLGMREISSRINRCSSFTSPWRLSTAACAPQASRRNCALLPANGLSSTTMASKYSRT